MKAKERFHPNWASPPGNTIADVLEAEDISREEFARSVGLTQKQTKELLCGEITIDENLAERLHQSIGPSVVFWTVRETKYRENIDRIQNPLASMDDAAWLRSLPVTDMVRFGWIEPVANFSDKIAACLQFFDVPDVDAWCKKYGASFQCAAYRTSPTFKMNPGGLSVWLRKGEIESESLDCRPWDAELFNEKLKEIRRLTWKKNPNLFIPKLRKICAECGVAVVIVRAPTGCRASGATLFSSPDKATLLLSFRYLSDDHFWFTFFHEAGHLILHGEKGLYLEGKEVASSKDEDEANTFAANNLIPMEFQSSFLELPINARAILNFAKRIGVSPGIIVGQLQYIRHAGPNQLNKLKRRYDWDQIEV